MNRKNFGEKTWIVPMPVLIIGTYGENGDPDAMNAAWGGIYDTGKIGICLSSTHKTVKNLLRTKAFTVSFATEKEIRACDYVGLVSANDTPDKMQKTGWHAVKSEFVNAPYFEELPVTLDCELISYDEDSGYTIARIVNVSASEEVLDEEGKIDMEKFAPVVFDTVTATYKTLGKVSAKAFSEGLLLK